MRSVENGLLETNQRLRVPEVPDSICRIRRLSAASAVKSYLRLHLHQDCAVTLTPYTMPRKHLRQDLMFIESGHQILCPF